MAKNLPEGRRENQTGRVRTRRWSIGAGTGWLLFAARVSISGSCWSLPRFALNFAEFFSFRKVTLEAFPPAPPAPAMRANFALFKPSFWERNNTMQSTAFSVNPSPATRRLMQPARPRHAALASVAALCLLAGAAHAALAIQPAADQKPADKATQKAPGRTTVFTLDLNFQRAIVDEKDAALKRALGMLPDRILELKNEIPNSEQAPPELFDIAAWLAGRPVRLAVEYDQANTKGGQFGGSQFGVGAVLSFAGSDDDLAAADKMISRLTEQGGVTFKSSKAAPVMSEIQTPIGSVRFGVRDSKPAFGEAGKRMEIHFGSLTSPDAIFKGPAGGSVAGLGKGGEKPYISGMLDLAPLTPLLGAANVFMAAMPQTAEILPNLQKAGYIGLEGVTIEHSMGHLPDRAYSTTRIVGLKKFAKESGLDGPGLTAADYKIIPADAHFGQIASKTGPSSMIQIKAMIEAQPESQNMLDAFSSTTGVDLFADIAEQIGDVSGFYLSDSTGGGTLASLVVFTQLKDPARVQATLAKLASSANRELSKGELARGYISVRETTVGGVTITGLRFPGLPIPFEPTFAVAGKYLVATLTPQAAIAAAEQIAGRGDAGITGNESIASLLPKDKALQSLTFNDARKTIAGGYGLVTLSGSMLSNLVRSRADEGGKLSTEAREPGIIVPTYNALRKNARSQITATYFSGDDLLTEWQGDRSLLVNMSSTIGSIMPFAPIVIAAAGGTVAAVAGENGKRFMNPRFNPNDEPMADPDDDQPEVEPMDAPNKMPAGGSQGQRPKNRPKF